MTASQGTAAPTTLFDETLQARRILRAKARQSRSVPFLLERAVDDLCDRLQDVNRDFSRACLVGPFDWREIILSRLPEGKIDRFDWAEDPQPSADYDLVVSLFHLQSLNAVGGWMQGVRAMLIPDGLFVACLIGGSSLSGLRQALYTVDTERHGAPTPRIHPMIEVRSAAQLLAHAGLAIPVTDSDRFTVQYRSLRTLAGDLRDLALTNTLSDQSRIPSPNLLGDLETRMRPSSDEPIPIRWEIVWMTGWVPHESQQKPLKPGSAKMGLNAALRALRDPSG